MTALKRRSKRFHRERSRSDVFTLEIAKTHLSLLYKSSLHFTNILFPPTNYRKLPTHLTSQRRSQTQNTTGIKQVCLPSRPVAKRCIYSTYLPIPSIPKHVRTVPSRRQKKQFMVPPRRAKVYLRFRPIVNLNNCTLPSRPDPSRNFTTIGNSS